MIDIEQSSDQKVIEIVDDEEKSDRGDNMDDLISTLVETIKDKKESAIGIFLSKMHKHNTNKTRKINDIRLRNLKLFLDKVIKNMPEDEKSILLLFQLIIGLLRN